MFIALLLHAAKSYELLCQSPEKHAELVKDGELISIAVVTRHGMRTPQDSYASKEFSGTWHCDRDDAQAPRSHVTNHKGIHRRFNRIIESTYAQFSPNCEAGELIIEGMEQHNNLGKFYRKWLVDDMKFLPPYFDKDLVTLRVSKVERCLRSAVSFMNGFYPPLAPGEVVTMTTGSDYREFLYPSPDGCKEMTEMWNNFISLPSYKERKAKSMALYKPIFEQLGIKEDETNWMFLGDWMISYLCTNQSLPLINPSDEIITQAIKDIAYYSYGYFNTSRGVAASMIWRHLFKDMDDFIGKKPGLGKFRLYSAHDTTIAALLVSLGFYDEKLPPFRSHLAIELWRVKGSLKLRVVFNGEPVGIDFMDGQSLVDYIALKTKMASRGDLGYCLAEYPQE